MKDILYHLPVKDCRAIKTAEIGLSETMILTGCLNEKGMLEISRFAHRLWFGKMVDMDVQLVVLFEIVLAFASEGRKTRRQRDVLRCRSSIKEEIYE